MDQSGGGDSWDFKAGGVFKRLLAACAGDRNMISAPSLPADSTPSPTATGAPLPPPPCLPPPSATLNLPPPIHPKLPPSQHQQRLPLKSLPPRHPASSPPAFEGLEGGRAVSYLIILGEQLGEFRIPPLRCFFLGERADGCSSSTAKDTHRMSEPARRVGKAFRTRRGEENKDK